MTQNQIEEAKQIAVDLVRLKDRLGRIGMFQSMHAIDVATNALGFELSDLLQSPHVTVSSKFEIDDEAMRQERLGI